jgi:hypothetical protein
MNTTDMYVREKSNQVHLDEMRRDIQRSRLLRRAADINPRARADLARQWFTLLASATVSIVLIGLAVAAMSNSTITTTPIFVM